MNPPNKKSLDLDQDSRRNQRAKIRYKINREEREKSKLNLKLTNLLFEIKR